MSVCEIIGIKKPWTVLFWLLNSFHWPRNKQIFLFTRVRPFWLHAPLGHVHRNELKIFTLLEHSLSPLSSSFCASVLYGNLERIFVGPLLMHHWDSSGLHPGSPPLFSVHTFAWLCQSLSWLILPKLHTQHIFSFSHLIPFSFRFVNKNRNWCLLQPLCLFLSSLISYCLERLCHNSQPICSTISQITAMAGYRTDKEPFLSCSRTWFEKS